MEIVYSSVEYVTAFWAAIDEVARERRFLLFTKAPEIEKTRAFLEEVSEKKWSQFFAIEDDQVVGWCDVLPYPYEGCEHNAHLGMGVLESHRGKGLGESLIRRALEDAFEKGIERVELEVFSSNVGARGLYEKVGFVTEGCKVGARKLDGQVDDNYLMRLMRSEYLTK